MDRQEGEIVALTSIYDASAFSVEKHPDTGLYSGCYSCHFKLDSPYLFIVKTDSSISKSLEVNYLPPIYLHFTLPSDYPTSAKPNFTLTCCWLKPSQLSSIRDRLNEIVSENSDMEILFMWFTFLKDESLEFLRVESPIDLTAVTKESEGFLRKVLQKLEQSASLDVSMTPAADRIRLCENFDIEQEAADLMSTPFLCTICLCDRIGKKAAVIKPCRHLFCKGCLGDYFKSKVQEGSVRDICCPAESCDSLASESVIKSVVDDRTYARYDSLLLKLGLNDIGDLVYCPRPACQYPVIYDKGSTSATCPACTHAFCIFCRRTYHGVSPCRFGENEIEELRTKYLAGDSTEKMQLEERYGKIAIKQAIEEYDSTLFLKDNCRQCPSCKAWCQKIEGCNKMACSKCRSYFCWLCNKVLNRTDPYAHYSDTETGCAGRLFEGLNVMNEDNEEEESDDDDTVEDMDDSDSESDDGIAFLHQ